MISSVSASALSAIQGGQHRLSQSAQQVARVAVEDAKNLTQALVSAQQASLQVTAGIEMIEAANEALGSLFDAYA